LQQHQKHLASVLHLALENRVEDISLNELPANVRLYKLFDELLNKQFPLDSPAYPLALKTPSDFADHLNVHVNHLNSSVKSVTNLTTTQIIKEKMFEESKNLLKYQLGYCTNRLYTGI
jgi:AraC-like DNA-binding protein